jgi:hypothetical protein
MLHNLYDEYYSITLAFAGFLVCVYAIFSLPWLNKAKYHAK